ncbi:hypothetical protein TNCV_5110831 [Trichonephila clavipes]|nr:hypothetical protein TNCV_5110831 [Trichonephila clavipes]
MGNSAYCGSNPEAHGARFRLTTGHDFLGVYLHWLGLAVNEACPLCGPARMDGDHPLQCAGLDEYPAEYIMLSNDDDLSGIPNMLRSTVLHKNSYYLSYENIYDRSWDVGHPRAKT